LGRESKKFKLESLSGLKRGEGPWKGKTGGSVRVIWPTSMAKEKLANARKRHGRVKSSKGIAREKQAHMKQRNAPEIVRGEKKNRKEKRDRKKRSQRPGARGCPMQSAFKGERFVSTGWDWEKPRGGGDREKIKRGRSLSKKRI